MYQVKNYTSWVVAIPIKLHFIGLWHTKDKEKNILNVGEKIIVMKNR